MRTLLRKAVKAARVASNPAYRAALRRGVAASIEHDAVPLPRETRTVIDIGANRGQFAVYAAGRFHGAVIHCFEPVPEARAKLMSVLPANRDVTVHDVALSSGAGTAEFHVSADDDSSSMLPAADLQVETFPGSRRERTITVRTARLDEVLDVATLDSPVLMKLDIQGAELDALRGAPEVLARTDCVLVECSFVELYEGQALADEVIGHLRGEGFTLKGLYSPTVVDGRLLQADAFFARER